MLILARAVGETIVVGEDCYITVTQVRNNQVKLQVRAPLGVRVDRLEVRLAKDQGGDGEAPR